MNRPLWTGEEINALFGGDNVAVDLQGVSIDSRSIAPGDLFVALSGDPGPRFGGGDPNARDGHDFAELAVKGGAVAVMAHRELSVPAPVIRVPDTLDGLWRLGAAARQRCTGRIVAITGSSGKTTLRWWLENVLRAMAPTHASTGSLNNHWGVPLSLARMPATAAFGVFETGTNHAGEIAPLSRLIAPDVALLLNVLPAHIGNFRDMAALRREKLSIAEGLGDDGVLVLPHGLAGEAGAVNRLTFGGPAGDVSASAAPSGGHTDLRLDCAGETVRCRLPFTGPERVESVLALFAVLKALQVDLQLAAQQVAGLTLPPGRGDRLLVNGVTVIDDSYNANPASMKMALADLGQAAGGKVALLGEMLELGDAAAGAHRDIAARTAGLDAVVSFGAGFSAVHFAARHEHHDDVSGFDPEAFARRLKPGDTVLVKGSNKVFWQQDFVTRLVAVLARRDPPAGPPGPRRSRIPRSSTFRRPSTAADDIPRDRNP